MGPNALIQRFRAVDSKQPNQQPCMDALSGACQEMAKIVAEMRTYNALASQVPFNAYLTIEPGDKV